MKAVLVAGAAIFLSGAAHACLWDSDTLETEARGVPTAIKAVSGRFERNPALYYEMRFRRVSAQILKTPRDFNLYDDAAVAQSRLGKPVEAQRWIEKKRAVLSPINAENKEDWYRYFANAGTFSMQKWLLEGADKSNLADLKIARDQIKRAIEINPDAHFGREKYQLGFIEWLLNPKILKGTTAPVFWNPNDKKQDASKAVEGISGLVTEGLGWENVDVFRALGLAMFLDKERTSASYLAFLRATELMSNGNRTLQPGYKNNSWQTAKELGESALDVQDEYYRYSPKETAELQTTFKKLRAEADAYHIKRTDWMLERLRAGKHPDTHSDFWQGYNEAPAPYFKGNQFSAQRMGNWIPAIGTLLGVGILSGWVLRKRKRRGE